jgi:hypothetical protein
VDKTQEPVAKTNPERVLRFAQHVCDTALGMALLSFIMLPATLIYGAMPLEAMTKAIVTETLALPRQAYVDIIWALGFALMISIAVTVCAAFMLGIVYPLTRTKPKARLAITNLATLLFLSGWPLKLFVVINPGNYGLPPSTGLHYFAGRDLTSYASQRWTSALFSGPLDLATLIVLATTAICTFITFIESGSPQNEPTTPPSDKE